MILELSEEYLPKEVLFREKEMMRIKEVFINFKKWGMGTNLLLLGVTGSGKTTIIKKVIEEENNSIYISGSSCNTAHKVISNICGIRTKDTADVLSRTIEELKKKPKIIIIDEIDKVKNLNQLMNHLNEIYRKTMIPIIIITLRRDILNKIPIDARKTLFFERIGLSSYNANELQAILNDRLSRISTELPEISEGAVNFIAAIASKQGSARVLMNIAIRCLQRNNFSQEYISSVYDELIKQDWLGFINEINETERAFLESLVDTCSAEEEIASEQIQKIMDISPARACQLINTFEKYGVVKSRHENLGRAGGRRRLIKFASKEIYSDIKILLSI